MLSPSCLPNLSSRIGIRRRYRQAAYRSVLVTILGIANQAEIEQGRSRVGVDAFADAVGNMLASYFVAKVRVKNIAKTDTLGYPPITIHAYSVLFWR